MYYPPNNQPPYQQSYRPYQPSYFNPFDSEKHDLRKTANGLGWTLLISFIFMYALVWLNIAFLKLIGYHALNYSGFKGFSPILYFLDSGLTYSLFLFVPFSIYMMIKHLHYADILPFQHVSVGTAISCVFFGIAICMLANIPANIVSAFLKELGFNVTMPSQPKTDNLYANILYVIGIVVIPPLVEEFVFRGVVLNGLRKFGNGFAIFGSAFLFGMFHGNFMQIPFAFVVGLVFALIVVRTGNLWITIIIHALNNGFSVLCEFLVRYKGETFTTVFSNYIVVLLLAFGLLGAIFLAIKNKDFFKTNRACTAMPFSTRFFAMVTNPGMIAVLLFCIGEAVFMLKT